MKIQTINPATEEKIAEYNFLSINELETKIALAQEAFQSWSKNSSADRIHFLSRLSKHLKSNATVYAKLISEEMGKVSAEAVAEVEKCASCCDYYAKHGESFLRDVSLDGPAPENKVSFQPLGIIFGIMPWNFPFWQVIRFAVPTLQAGNVILLKHAPNTFGCAEVLEKAFLASGFPQGVLQNLIIDLDQAASVIKDIRVRGVSLTGSTQAGRTVGQLCGQELKKTVLELGGSDAYVILDDADLELAAEKCVSSRLLNAGQSCIAAKRFIVTAKNKKQFTELVLEKMRMRKMGEHIGPIARKDLRDQLHAQVQQAKKQGAKILLGGELPSGKGFYYPPTVLDQVKTDNVAFCEELFGPVAAIIEARNEDEAVSLANNTNYGLGGAVFSRDVGRAEKIAREQIQAGLCFINDFVRSDSSMPFGGIKNSGMGRELSVFGIHEFVNIKSICIY